MTEEQRYSDLRAELSAPDPSLPFEFDEPLEPEVEPEDPFKTYGRENIRTHIPASEHGDVRPDDKFTWVAEDEHGNKNYYLWRRGGDE
jgi:hypothetical protein